MAEQRPPRRVPNEDPGPSPDEGLRVVRGEIKVRYDLDTERSVLASVLAEGLRGWAVVEALVRPEDFYGPNHGHIFAAMRTLATAGTTPWPAQVIDQLRREKLLETVGGRQAIDLLGLEYQPGSLTAQADNARLVASYARSRRLLAYAAEMQLAAERNDHQAALDVLRRASTIFTPESIGPVEPDPDIDTFLNEPEPEYVWLIPGVLERQDRVILTGQEGHGKSTLLRQMAVQIASGIHPFTAEPMEPARVMLLDLENSKRQVRRKIRPLRLAAQDLDPSRLSISVVAAGLDLADSEDRRWLESRVVANRPDLLILGPLYKLGSGDPGEEKVAKPAAMFLDELRDRHDLGVLLEAHVPHPSGGGSKRPERPYGASLWMRWPEFGIFLAKDGAVRHWRGERDERDWPVMLSRGGEWPWTPVTDSKAITFARILDECRKAGKVLSERELAERIEGAATAGAKTTIHRAIDANRNQWVELARVLGAA